MKEIIITAFAMYGVFKVFNTICATVKNTKNIISAIRTFDPEASILKFTSFLNRKVGNLFTWISTINIPYPLSSLLNSKTIIKIMASRSFEILINLVLIALVIFSFIGSFLTGLLHFYEKQNIFSSVSLAIFYFGSALTFSFFQYRIFRSTRVA